jgi:hypothetical protein
VLASLRTLLLRVCFLFAQMLYVRLVLFLSADTSALLCLEAVAILIIMQT